MIKHVRNLILTAAATVLLGVPYLQAADVAISALPAGSALAGTEAIPAVQSGATVKTTPAAIKTYVETGGTVTASDPVLDLSQTWNNGAVTFTGLKLNVTDTASAAASKVFDFQVGGSSVVNATRGGLLLASGGFTINGNANAKITNPGDGQWQFGLDGDSDAVLIGNSGVVVDSGKAVSWSSTASSTGTPDVNLYRDAANALAQRNSTNAQTTRVYNTYTDSSNYERLTLSPGAASGWMRVGPETAGTGADNIGLAVGPTGTGALSAHVPDSGTGGGNARGAYAVDWQLTRGLATRVASGARSTIAGGTQNTASNDDATVGGGYFNTASGERAVIAGGYQGIASGTQATVGGGYGNTASAQGTTIAGGEGNIASVMQSAVLGGATNTASATRSTVGGGYTNTASGAHSGVLGGESNTSSGAHSAVGGGHTNTAGGTYSWIPGGYQATTRGLSGAYAYSAGQRSAQGDAQVIGQPVRRTTTDATPVSLSTNGSAPAAGTAMVIPDGAVMHCKATVAAKPSASITDGIGATSEASFYRSGTTTALLSTPINVIHGTNALALNVSLVANNTLESAEIEVTGKAATTIYWAGELKCVQVL